MATAANTDGDYCTLTTASGNSGAVWYAGNTFPYHRDPDLYSAPNFYSGPKWRIDWTQPEEDKKMETCHICKSAELREVDVHEWKEYKGKKDKVGEWKKTTTKVFECGTEVREGDFDKNVKRVLIGEGCAEFL